MEEFMKVYEAFKGSRPMKMSMVHLDSGIPRWRIMIFETGTAPSGGDMQLLHAEDPSKEECIRKAIENLNRRMQLEQEASQKAV